MDLAYLHLLQDLRNALPGFVETFFVLLSLVGDGPALVALALIVYWCLDKRVGQHAITALAIGTYVNQFLKNIVCVYRPWIRDPTIVPAEQALDGARGYSFPSGHTSGTASAFGSLAWQERKERRWVVVAGAAVTALMMFARNYLGVHTPQDVLVGLLIAVLSVVAAERLHAWVDRHDDELAGDTPTGRHDRIVLAAAVVIAAATMVFVVLKAYPLDYVGGELLVDPEEMRKGCFEAAGLWLGWALGWAMERRHVNFSTEGIDLRRRLMRGVIGVAIVGAAYLAGGLVFKAVPPHNVAKLVQYFLVAFLATFAAPLAFATLERRNAAPHAS